MLGFQISSLVLAKVQLKRPSLLSWYEIIPRNARKNIVFKLPRHESPLDEQICADGSFQIPLPSLEVAWAPLALSSS